MARQVWHGGVARTNLVGKVGIELDFEVQELPE